MKLPDNAFLLDVRYADEFNAGYLDGAVSVPHDMIIEKVGAVVPGKNTPVYLERSRYGAPNNDMLYGLCPCGSERIFFFNLSSVRL